MFADWKNDVAHVKKSFGELGKKHPKMLQAYGSSLSDVNRTQCRRSLHLFFACIRSL